MFHYFVERRNTVPALLACTAVICFFLGAFVKSADIRT